jgi:PAS domain S-box-containing protein
MDQTEPHGQLPARLERLLRRLERVTGQLPLSHAVSAILAIGVLLTAALTTAVWWVEGQRTLNEFDADVGRIQLLIQDRLDHRAVMVEQVAAWASEQAHKGAIQSGTWTAAGVTVLPSRSLSSPELANLLGVSQTHADVLRHCMGSANEAALSLCGTSQSGEQEGRFLVRPVLGESKAWVVVLLEDIDLLRVPVSNVAWRFRASLLGSVPLPAEQGSGQAHERQAVRPLTIAGQTLTLNVLGDALPRSWSETLLRQTGMWVAGASGLLCTVVALYVYLMLISTRRRARLMAQDMSLALQQTQSRNQAVMDTAPDAILMTDAAGCVRWCNQATTSIFGRTRADMDGQPLSQVLPALGEVALDDWFSRQGFSNRVIGYETTGLRNEGTAFPVAISASRTQLDGELIQTFFVRDTTDAKWAEQELLLRERALASSADGVLIISMTLPKQPIIYVNHAFESITGYEAHEVLGRNCRFLQCDDHDQPGLHTMRTAISQGLGCKVVVRNYRKNGCLFYNELAISPVLNPEGVLTHYVGVQTDITDRIASEQSLHLRTERLNAVFDLSPDGFVVLDRRGEVSIVNPAFERMTGLMAADLVGQSLSAFEEQLARHCLPGEASEGASGAAFGGGAEAEGGGTSRELIHLHTPCRRTLIKRMRQGSQDKEVVLYFRDITHELEVDRMKSDFLSMAAHELRTPMASIFGFTELLMARPFSEERRHDMLSTIHRQAKVLIDLVNELLDLARIESRRGGDFKRQTQALQPIIHSTASGLLVHGDARTVGLTLPEEPIFVDVDVAKLSLALTNVLSNAYKFSPQGGDIELDLVWRGEEGHGEVGIRVTDHGLGMTPEQIQRVFDRFFRADASGNIPGTGLGMTIVKEIIELHGGAVSVNSAHGVGTTVILWLPLHAALSASAGQQVMAGHGPVASPLQLN